jgi:hypothetical protein
MPPHPCPPPPRTRSARAVHDEMTIRKAPVRTPRLAATRPSLANYFEILAQMRVVFLAAPRSTRSPTLSPGVILGNASNPMRHITFHNVTVKCVLDLKVVTPREGMHQLNRVSG